MKKKEPQITVTTIYDGANRPKDLFADIIIHRFLQESEKKRLPKTKTILYNEHSVPQNQGLSGLCGETP